MKNKYEIRGDVTAIIINSPKYGRKEALISTSKLQKADEFPNSWCVILCKVSEEFYVKGNIFVEGKNKTFLLHRWITDANKGMVVDHENHRPLDNTDLNLRIVTQAENKQNLYGAHKNSKSGIRGVSWHKKAGKWKAVIKNIHLGLFTDINEAERVVKEARKNYMPYSKEASA